VEIECSKKEFHLKHAPFFTAIVQTRIPSLKEILGIIEINVNITIKELVALVDHKLEVEERALDNSYNVFDTDRIFTKCKNLGVDQVLDNRKEWELSPVIENTS
jgi:hypothetical protein